MTKETRIYLEQLLLRVDKAIHKTSGASAQLKGKTRLKLIEEMIREQIQHEDTRYPARSAR